MRSKVSQLENFKDRLAGRFDPSSETCPLANPSHAKGR